MGDIFGFNDAVIPEAILRAPPPKKKSEKTRKVPNTSPTKLNHRNRSGKAPAATSKHSRRKPGRDTDVVGTSTPVGTPLGKENSRRASRVVESVDLSVEPTGDGESATASPVVWIPKVKEKKADRSLDDPEFVERKAQWLEKMNAEFARVDQYKLTEEAAINPPSFTTEGL